MQKVIKLSVHDIVDTLLRQGSIDNRVFSSSTMQEGTRLHSFFQKQQDESYESEVFLSSTFVIDDITFIIEGRADGVIKKEDGSFVIDEIKTTVADLEQFYKDNADWHLGQAKIYAYIYANDHDLRDISVRLSYISQNDYKIQTRHVFKYTRDELSSFTFSLLDLFYKHIKVFLLHQESLAFSLSTFSFPYEQFRLGQDLMIHTLEKARDEGSFAYVEAPTGIGKTAAAIYPFIAFLGKKAEKVFYLTSKNSIKKIALDTLRHFNSRGANLKGISISSKESLCINSLPRACNPSDCPYALDYYQKLNRVLLNTYLSNDILDQETILELGEKYQICPFEFQLDLSTYYDFIVADYNHLYHPTAHLMRFFDAGPRPYHLLVDECHNLPSRVRSMHSGEINYFDLYRLKKELSGKKTLSIRKRITKILDLFVLVSVENFDSDAIKYRNIISLKCIPEDFVDSLEKFYETAKEFLKSNSSEVKDKFLEVYFSIKSFLDLPQESPDYAYYYSLSAGKAVALIAMCLDSRSFMKPAKSIFLSGCFFSATLAPYDFYLDMLSAGDNREELILKSPFDSSNFKVLINPLISTKYKDRERTIVDLVSSIKAFVSVKKGNYLVFFPSYQYLNSVKEFFNGDYDYELLIQDSRMDENSRQEFLSRFKTNPDHTTIGFCVMGGIFSEGIDLTADRLIGAIIVGVGLPSICYENDRLKSYYEDEDHSGYDYAYLYPGLNKVFQAVGRVIRSEEDKGMVLLLDQRYMESNYKEIVAPRYINSKLVLSPSEIKRAVEEFWKG